jgi:hypothetical protein
VVRSTPRSVAIAIAVVAISILTFDVRPARAAVTVDLDQWATKDAAWQNGNLNGNNSRYPEGGIVPFRVAFEGLATGNHTIHINYDFTAGGHKAYDFLATWNATNAKGKACAKSGGAISKMCPNLPDSSSIAFPSDGYKANGLKVSGAQTYSGVSRRLTIWGGTITSISGPTHSGSPNGNSTADFLVRFRASGKSVLLAWGGHLAQSSYWDRSAGGPADGAAQVSGAPWHMRTLTLDGTGNKNQDRSIQPSAIVGELPPGALAPAPPPTAAPTPRAAAPTPDPDDPRPAAPAGPHTPFPRITPPPTSTDPPAEPRSAVMDLVLVAGMGLLMLSVLLTGERRRPRGSRRRS